MIARQALLLFYLIFASGKAFSQHFEKFFAPSMAPSLQKTIATAAATDSIQISLTVKDLSKFAQYKKQLHISADYLPAGAIIVKTTVAVVKELLTNGAVAFSDVVKTPKEELTTGYLDLSVNKINYAHQQYPAIMGAGIVASIKEQRFDTSDIDIKGRYINSGVAASTVTSHAGIMATTMAGAGNSSPYAKGAAPQATVTSSSFASLLPDADGVFKQYGITVQNHSYGTAPESYYGTEAAAYDKSMVNNPELIHVFSAGNAGNTTSSNGAYAGLAGVANLTGNFKQAKNIVVVGAIDSFYHVATASSKGPAYDGRVKPELVAFGEDGSSGAAAIVSGTAILVQQAYKSVFKMLPEAALVKAVLINSADDVGAAGIDYASGYGSANGYAAVQTIMQQKTFQNVVGKGQIKNFTIQVPAHTARLKVTLAWTDVPAAPNATKALVNDIDLTVKNGIQTWQPWVLNHQPDVAQLQLPAERKIDTLNNVEQVTIENPAGGDFTIEVQGSSMATSSQSFAIAWQTDTADFFEWTSPSRNDDVLAAQSNVLRWKTNLTGKMALYYGINNQWKLITDTVDAKQSYYKWVAPDTISLAQLKIVQGANSVLSDTFVISKPLSLNTGFNCVDSFLLYWNHSPAQQYTVFNLTTNYLSPVANTADTAIIFNKSAQPSIYYSVAPVVGGRTGMKSFILNYTAQGTECYTKSFYLRLQDGGRAEFSATIGSLYNVVAVSFQKLVNGKYENIQTISKPAQTDFNFIDPTLTKGVNVYRVEVLLRDGNAAYSNLANAYYFPDTEVIIYPNPAPQNTPIHMATNKAGRIKIEIVGANGTLIKQVQLSNLVNNLPPFQLSKGLYFIRIINDEGKVSTQKLVVY